MNPLLRATSWIRATQNRHPEPYTLHTSPPRDTTSPALCALQLECAFKPASEASDSDPLVIDDFMGIFVLTAIFIVVSVVWSVLLKRFAAGDEVSTNS